MSTHDVDVGGGRQWNAASLLGDVNNDDQPKPVISECSDVCSNSERDNVLLNEAAQNIMRHGYLPRIVRRAIDRIHEKHGPGHVLTDQCLLDEIEKMQQEGNLPNARLKRPTHACAENQHNVAMSEDLDEMRQQNEEMRRLLVCKSCDNGRVSHVIVNCGHMICVTCTRMKKCFFCGSVIEKVQIVKFGDNL
ncbi:RING finger protein PFF0165c-like isoform X3 [Ostrea edulis]|uniref:RING finger protein PFF0165c-like isoform X3 n=1 Tax=Ostrea edulis TaxID=37623 RepID=UPI0024AE9D82|nr:RING finger protein PFF0165c-like isoform X3 [Ostrea edulis]XP_056015526.1 RING finger protein PFF0165c-like isoform X3 [Ostrea edulis]